MHKYVSKILAIALALMLVVASVACLADTRQVRALDGYEQKDGQSHYAIYTAWSAKSSPMNSTKMASASCAAMRCP